MHWISHSLITEFVRIYDLGLSLNCNGGVHCTLVGLQLTAEPGFENTPNKDLEFWALKLGLPDYAKDLSPYKRKDARNFSWNAPLSLVGIYNAHDAIAAWRLAEWQRKRIDLGK